MAENMANRKQISSAHSTSANIAGKRKWRKKAFKAMTKVLVLAVLVGVLAPLAEAQYGVMWDDMNNARAKRLLVTGPSDLRSTTTVRTLQLTVTDTEPGTTEGMLYGDDSEGAPKYYNGSQWISLLTTGSGGGTLDEAYDYNGAGNGRTINATDGAVTITSTDAESAYLLAITPTPSSSAALGGISITSGANSTQSGLKFANSGSGDDIQGTSDTWAVTAAGAGVFTSVVIPTVQVTTLLNVDDTVDIDFADNGETFDITTSTTDHTADAAVATIYSSGAGATNATYLLRLRNAADGDAQDHFLVLEDNDGDDQFSVNSGGVVVIAGTTAMGGNLTLDDNSGASPSLTFTDATNDDAVFSKVDNSHLTMTIPSDSAFQVLTGNLRVGNGSPGSAAMDGEDVYIEGDLEVDGTFTIDGTFSPNDVTLQNGATIKNDTDTEIEFGENGEDVSLDFGTDMVTWATDTGVATMAFGDVDALTGIGSIGFDQAASSISLVSNGTADDLTLDLTGATNSSIILNSTGTADDAISLQASVGGVTIGTAAAKDIFLTAGAAGDVIIPADIGLTFGTGEKIEGDSTDLTLTSGAKIELTATTDVIIPTSVGVTFGDGEKIEGNDTDLTVTSGGAINLTAVTDVVVPTSVGVTFGDGEKIEGNDTDLTVTSGGAINLTATGAGKVVVPANVGITYGTGDTIIGDNTKIVVTSGGAIDLTAGTDVVIPVNVGILMAGTEKIESDGTDISFTVGALGDINIGSDIGLKFGDDGEGIEGDGTDLVITGNNISLTSGNDVIIPVNIGLLFGDGEKIEGNDTDLTLTSGAEIELTATTDIVVPTSVGILFGDGEKIEGNDTDLTLTSGADITLAATADVNIANGIGLVLATDGNDHIESNGTNLTLTTAGDLVLAATGDVNIAHNVGLEFAADGNDHIESNGTNLTLTTAGDLVLAAALDVNIPTTVGLTFGADEEKIEGDMDDLTVTSGRDIILTPTSSINMSVAIEKAAGTTTKLNGDYQPEFQSVSFDIEEAILDADTGTGIKIESHDLQFAGKILRAWVDITQGCGDAGDTLELYINDTDDATTPTTTLVAAQDCAAASLLAFTAASSTTVPLATVSATQRYLVALYKDVGNDAGTSANLQGVLYVEYVRN